MSEKKIGYVIVQNRSNSLWLAGCNSFGPVWIPSKLGAKQFDSQATFREWHQQWIGRHWTWSGDLRFVRLVPRRPS